MKNRSLVIILIILAIIASLACGCDAEYAKEKDDDLKVVSTKYVDGDIVIVRVGKAELLERKDIFEITFKTPAEASK